MSKKKKGLVPNFEIIMVAVFIFSFMIWAISKCDFSRPVRTTHIEPTPEPAPTTTEPSPTTTTEVPTLNTSQTTTPPTVVVAENTAASSDNTDTKLYITINNLKLRKAPNLDSEVVAQLPLFEQVSFLNEVTDSTQQINLGYETADEPWVKIKTQAGTIGWVYGAGVHYYKRKRSGVLE